MNKFCSNESFQSNSFIFDEPCHFSSNYEIRIYQSGCFYLDSNNQWQSDGLLVSVLFFLLTFKLILFNSRLDHQQSIMKHNVFSKIQ